MKHYYVRVSCNGTRYSYTAEAASAWDAVSEALDTYGESCRVSVRRVA